MKYNELGKTGIKVSQLCFGSLTLSPLQKNLSLIKSEQLIKQAYEKGINFIDTSEYYNNYDKIKAGISSISNNIVICSKTYAYEAKAARESVEKALRELNRDYIDIYCLHEQESHLTLKGHAEALIELTKLKEQGKIRAIGISTHYIAGVLAACEHPMIDIVQTITNYHGLGIVDGTMPEMLKAIKRLKDMNKAVYGMKPLGGGNLHRDIVKAFNYVKELSLVDSMAIGLQNKHELDFAVDYLCNNQYNKELLAELTKQQRKLHIASWCTGCGNCIRRCQQQALTLVDNKAVVDTTKCYLCGYCSQVCEEFCIKII